MGYDDERHAIAIGALPALWRTLFRLHDFYGVDIARMADTLATDQVGIRVCLDEARMMIHRQFPLWEHLHPLLPGEESPGARLEQRLRFDYRAAVDAGFVEGGYVGTISWPAASTSIEADEEAAARFVLSFLRQPLQKTHARSTKYGVAMVDLRHQTPHWRWIQRRHLREIAAEIHCSGLRRFELWLADRIAPHLHYPSRLILPHRRQALPEELDPSQTGYHVPCWPDDASRQRRFDELPPLTQHVAALNLLYGRSHYEIARRLGISRHGVDRRLRNAVAAMVLRS